MKSRVFLTKLSSMGTAICLILQPGCSLIANQFTFEDDTESETDFDTDTARDTDPGIRTDTTPEFPPSASPQSDAGGNSDTVEHVASDTHPASTDAGAVKNRPAATHTDIDTATETDTQTPIDTPVCSSGEVRLCPNALGNCSEGTQTCAADGSSWSECSILPQDNDSCELGDDANCNGSPNENCDCDEGTQQPCGPSTEQGICVFGSTRCIGGNWSACDGATLPDNRNCASSDDNDCNGTPDNEEAEYCTCKLEDPPLTCDPYGKNGVGICKLGSQICTTSEDGTTSEWGPCTGAVEPQTEICDEQALDEDCDSLNNEECACVGEESKSCGIETGMCQTGTQACVDGQWSAECDGDIGPQGRDCTSGEDNDCDGSPDNTIDSTCQCTPGNNQSCETDACKPGTQTCMSGNNGSTSYWGACTGVIGPCGGATPVCFNEACVECTPYDWGCANDGVTPQSCSATGQWHNEDPCSGNTPICDDDTGECICLEDTMNCLNDTTERECISGTWVPNSCSGTTPVCYDSHCTECKPPDRVCANNSTLQICQENGTWENDTCEVICIDDECIDPADEAGVVLCDPSDGLVCNAPQFCCFDGPYDGSDGTGTCVSSDDDCESLNTKLFCDGPNDCTGEVCCLQTNAAASSTVCLPQTECVTEERNGRRTVCNPEASICPSGESCQLGDLSTGVQDRWEADLYLCLPN